ncbi:MULTISPECIES: glutamine--fructose-6-phosphate transaminase (isomerizing) [Vagococcus]|uniref:Glutamine--fructose-6-phosphate aminotransferase [isomerizing] n=1 Tax=Vagococcus fluvialis bH819 TaxID=1255619 RepID=A0A1X6WNP3_9ENTE|nr:MULTISPECIES: glutamine--fructose-6-phosphate transaminase (isomerizing) [Vagococcus]SLM85953.1 Glucosamine--fructose-6-phosphate aminotransferase [isomerizing] [Vagococcus fluvialis bH819]HCM88320.1 glutamine--fructose-6-phosphate transaminase (isomerizing) [Vagococcus sp.]
MCGIVGVVGSQNTKNILLNGLHKLEYRGYDSAGIMLSNEQGMYVSKTPGRVAELEALVSDQKDAGTGIGHTRWATHGQPTENNAHPHLAKSGRFGLVHNGVIENYETLRDTYLTDITLAGDTDSEIIVEVVDYFSRQGLSTLDAFTKMLGEVKGSYALALIDVEDDQKIYLAKNKSPLLIGLADGYNLVGSDALAMIAETDRFVEIMDGERIILTATQVTILDVNNQEVSRDFYVAEIDANDAEKGLYPHYMAKEIDEQPAVMRTLIQEYMTIDGKSTIDSAILDEMTASDRIYIVGCGTSWHAGIVGKKIIEELTGIPVEIHLASEMGYDMPILSKKPYFIFLTQSGETADSRQVLVKVNAMKLPSLTITNVKGSTLSREATHTLLLHAGPEIAVASTKAYTSQIAVMAFLAKAMGEKLSNAYAQALDLVHELGIVAAGMETLVDMKEDFAKLSEDFFFETRNAFYIGRGLDYAVSLEGSLKLKEISYIQAEGFAAGELKHGTIALIEDNTPVVAIISNEEMGSHTRGNVKEVESRGAKTLVIAVEGFEKDTDAIVLPHVHGLISPLLTVIPLQFLAYYASLQRDLDVDKPRNLAKSVTVE